MKQDKLLYYAIGFILIAILGYFLATYSWNNVMNILTATETPTLIPTPTPTPMP